jgi:hypothetical protein
MEQWEESANDAMQESKEKLLQLRPAKAILLKLQ